MELGETQSPFHIEVSFRGGLTESQKQALREAQDAPINGVGRILGQAGPRPVRPASAGSTHSCQSQGQFS
jgi:hypothetical protein